MLLRRRFFSESVHNIKGPSPPLSSRGRPKSTQRPWHHDPRKVTAVLGLVAGGAYGAAHLRYGATEPFTGRTHLSVLSHKEALERDEAEFAKFKKKHAAKILSPSHDDTVRVRRIALAMVRAAHHGLAIRQHCYTAKAQESRGNLTHGGLNWMDGLDWEVIVVTDPSRHAAESFPGAGKIVVYPELFRHHKIDDEIAVTLSHEVGHVIARHSSGIFGWLDMMIEDKPILKLIVLPFLLPFLLPSKRRCELEADHIGILVLAAAGVDPTIAVQVRQKAAMASGEVSTLQNLLAYFRSCPSSKKRWQFLSQPKVLGEALELYKRVASHAQD
ncbi:hypothetical protein ACQ4PT_017991 [Festuca glaucescens]